MSKCHKKADWFINFNQKSLPDSKDGGVDEIDNSKQNFYIGQTLHYHIVWPFKAFQKQIQFSHVHRQQKTLDIQISICIKGCEPENHVIPEAQPANLHPDTRISSKSTFTASMAAVKSWFQLGRPWSLGEARPTGETFNHHHPAIPLHNSGRSSQTLRTLPTAKAADVRNSLSIEKGLPANYSLRTASMSRSQARTIRRMWFTSPLLFPQVTRKSIKYSPTLPVPGSLLGNTFYFYPTLKRTQNSHLTNELTANSKKNASGTKCRKSWVFYLSDLKPGTHLIRFQGPSKQPKRSFNSPTSYLSWSRSCD